MSKVTIEDISRQTGLSRGTVSRALNDRPDISQRTKQRVLDACQKLNYAPSFAARTLATGRNFAVAVVVSDLDSPFDVSFVRGVLDVAQRAHYMVNLLELGADTRRATDRLRTLTPERIDGVLLSARLESTGVEWVESLGKRPVVSCWPMPSTGCDVLSPDQTESGRLVARHLLRSGPKPFLYVHRTGTVEAEDRLAGFQAVCRENGVNPQTCTLALTVPQPSNDFLVEAIRPHAKTLCALAATDDSLAIDLMMACVRHNRMPGRDIVVIGQDNSALCHQISPSLSSVDFSGEEVGRRALDVMLKRLDKSRMDAPQTTYVTPVLIERESSRVRGD